MSDFGSMIIVKKKDYDISEEDSRSVEELIATFNDENKFRDFSGDTVHLKPVENIEFDGSKSIAIIVTEYWDEGLDEGSYGTDSMEEILEGDKVVVEDVIDYFKGKISHELLLESYLGDW